LYVSGAPFVTVHEMVDGSPAVTVEGVAKADETAGGDTAPAVDCKKKTGERASNGAIPVHRKNR
jgi:hypothetical protein